MSVTGIVAMGIIGIAFLSFFVMATIMYGQFVLKAWRPMFMSMAVLLILLMIMKRATDIATADRQQGLIEAEEQAR
jgi:uncharacterized membrane protein